MPAYIYTRTSSNWSAGDPITALRLNQLNTDLDNLLKRLEFRDASWSYDVEGNMEEFNDNINGIQIVFDWTNYELLGSFTIQEVGDPKKFTISYTGPFPTSCIYA